MRRSSGQVPIPQTNFVPPASIAPYNVVLQEAETVEGDGIGRLFDVAPDGRGGADVADVEAEAFDGEPAIVMDIAQGLKDGWPFDVAAAGNAAIVFAGVHVAEMF